METFSRAGRGGLHNSRMRSVGRGKAEVAYRYIISPPQSQKFLTRKLIGVLLLIFGGLHPIDATSGERVRAVQQRKKFGKDKNILRIRGISHMYIR